MLVMITAPASYGYWKDYKTILNMNIWISMEREERRKERKRIQQHRAEILKKQQWPGADY